MKRFAVEKCDNGGTLIDDEGVPLKRQVTWAVVDRQRLSAEGFPECWSDHDTRAAARVEAARMNDEAEAVARRRSYLRLYL